VQYGFGEVSYSLMEAGLLDELRLWVHPFFVGAAKSDDLLFRHSQLTSFELVDTTTLSNGIVILSYRIA
jgi:riboflavin biosynthesis pyrimidine reductase